MHHTKYIYITYLVTCIITLMKINNSSKALKDCDGITSDKETFALASKQSFGFFTDIPESQWRVAQGIHAKSFPNCYGGDASAAVANKWYAENFQEEFHCGGARRIPSNSMGDGPKWVCDPHRIANKMECLVYSFGSYGDVEFERGIRREIGDHCEIHTFDVEKENEHYGDFKKAVESVGGWFHHWGLGTEEQAFKFADTGEGPPMYTLQQTLEKLGHKGRVIDIFKIDCESCEWETYQQFIESGDLRQILVEVNIKRLLSIGQHVLNFPTFCT